MRYYPEKSNFKNTIQMKNLLSFFFIAYVPIALFAQALPSHVALQELGLSFDIPPGWTGQIEGEYILLGHNSIPGIMILSQNNSLNTEEMVNLAGQGIEEEGLQLRPEAQFETKGSKRVEGSYTGWFNGSQVKAYAIGMINNLGSGINILILTESKLFNQVHKAEANKLANSVRFYQAKESGNTVFWKNKLLGKQLKYLYTNTSTDYEGGSVGLSEITTIDLCSDGSFFYYSNSQSHIAVGSTAADQSTVASSGGANLSNNNTSGTYLIYSLGQETFLELSFQNGTVVEYDLSANDSGQTFLDNTRYLVLENQRCK
jgi:hypothetical protein